MTLLVYFAVAILNNLEPEIGSLLPVAANPSDETHWAVVVVMVSVVVTIHAITHGATPWSRRIRASDT
ncbi:hypothetical protein SAMN05216174_1056 [Actinokineospora iranica]|uniref:Uncharacterized protein n=2 Tax=Actinokineospora iranica TaxID=1271860 RepID=A0A1G6Q1G3_9PSEU|nr:hypothetical protein SAMN05216174_1056 [Actinokineospora iranica]